MQPDINHILQYYGQLYSGKYDVFGLNTDRKVKAAACIHCLGRQGLHATP